MKSNIIKIFLIALLGLIIIAVIANNILNNLYKTGIQEMANKIKVSAEYYYTSFIWENQNFQEQKFDLSKKDIQLNIVGTIPEHGYITIYDEGKTDIWLYYRGYCATKTKNETSFAVEKKSSKNCKIEE